MSEGPKEGGLVDMLSEYQDMTLDELVEEHQKGWIHKLRMFFGLDCKWERKEREEG